MPLECEQIRNEFSALLDNELNPEDRELVEEHLSDCSDCLRELHGYKVVSDTYRYHHPVKAPEDFEERFHAAVAPIGRKRTLTWQRWGLAAAAGFTVIAGVAVWQSQSRISKMASTEMANYLASDSVPQSAPAAEAPQTAMFKAPAAESAQESSQDKDGTPSVRALESASAPAELNSNEVSDRYRRDAAAPPAVPGEASPAPEPGTDLKRMAVVQPEALPRLSTDGIDSESGRLGGGGAPQAAPAPARAPVVGDSAPFYNAEEPMKSKAAGSASPSALAESSSERAAAPESAPVELKMGVVKSESDAHAARPNLAAAAKKEDAGASDAAAAPASLNWHDLTFTLIEGSWRQEDYASEPLTKIAIPSDAWNAILDQHPDLVKLCDRIEPVIVKLGETWYQFTTTADGDTTGR